MMQRMFIMVHFLLHTLDRVVGHTLDRGPDRSILWTGSLYNPPLDYSPWLGL